MPPWLALIPALLADPGVEPAPPAPTPPPEVQAPAPEPTLQRKRLGIGLGGGFWELDLGTPSPVLWPAFVLSQHHQRPLGRRLGFHESSMIVVQDWETIGGVYDWYGKLDHDQGEDAEDLRVLKYLVLWPGLILAPLAGSNLHSTFLLDLAIPADPLVVHVGGGLQAGMLLRPSEERLIFDVTAGVASAVMVDLGSVVSIDLRGLWNPPVFHAMAHPPMNTSFTYTGNLVFWLNGR